jgi:acetyl-CoA carboxylase beta subunit
VKKISESITLSKQTPFIMISKSGGARMMEAAYSLMQLAKHRANTWLAEEKIHTSLYVQILQQEEQLHHMPC